MQAALQPRSPPGAAFGQARRRFEPSRAGVGERANRAARHAARARGAGAGDQRWLGDVCANQPRSRRSRATRSEADRRDRRTAAVVQPATEETVLGRSPVASFASRQRPASSSAAARRSDANWAISNELDSMTLLCTACPGLAPPAPAEKEWSIVAPPATTGTRRWWRLQPAGPEPTTKESVSPWLRLHIAKSRDSDTLLCAGAWDSAFMRCGRLPSLGRPRSDPARSFAVEPVSRTTVAVIWEAGVSRADPVPIECQNGTRAQPASGSGRTASDGDWRGDGTGRWARNRR